MRYAAPIERTIDKARWAFAEDLYEARCQGLSYRSLAEGSGCDRSTVRRYALVFERWARNGLGIDHAPSCNEIQLRCRVCEESFTASRADARHCSNACRQDAYRKRKLDEVKVLR